MAERTDKPRDHMWDPATQTMPRDELVDLQNKRLARLIERVWNKPVPLFARKLEAAGLSEGDAVGLGELPKIPFTVKDELRASERDHPPFGDYRGTKLNENVRIGTTGGTSGAPTTVLWTKHDLTQDDEAGARMFWRQGLRPGFVIANSHPLDIYGGGRSLVGVLENFGTFVLAVGPPETEQDARRAIELFRRAKPLAYQMFPSQYRRYYEVALEMGLDPAKDINLHPPQENPEMAYRTITGGTEGFAFMGSACPQGGGAHVCEDFVIVEAVDDDGQPVPDGERGLMVITSLERDNFVLRYNLEDYIVINPEHLCECAETHRRVMWEGRKKDITRVDGVEMLPREVAEVIFDFEELRTPTLEYQIVRHGATQDQDALHLRVEFDADRFGPGEPVGERLVAAIDKALGVPAQVELVDRGVLPRPSYKPERVVDSGG